MRKSNECVNIYFCKDMSSKRFKESGLFGPKKTAIFLESGYFLLDHASFIVNDLPLSLLKFALADVGRS